MVSKCIGALRTSFRENVVVPCKKLTIGELAVSCIVGVLGGVFPVPLVTTAVTVALAQVMRCSPVQLVFATAINFCCTPLQLLCIPVFARYAALLLQRDPSEYTAAALQQSFQSGLLNLLASSGTMILLATLAWSAITLPLILYALISRKPCKSTTR